MHPLNILDIELTFWVSNLDKSIEVNAKQPENKSDISFTLLMFKLEIFIEANFLHSLNILSIVSKFGVLKFWIFIEVKDGESGKENPYRTGRIIGFGKDFVEKFDIPHPIMYCEHTMFDKNFGKLLESRKNEIQSNEN